MPDSVTLVLQTLPQTLDSLRQSIFSQGPIVAGAVQLVSARDIGELDDPIALIANSPLTHQTLVNNTSSGSFIAGRWAESTYFDGSIYLDVSQDPDLSVRSGGLVVRFSDTSNPSGDHRLHIESQVGDLVLTNDSFGLSSANRILLPGGSTLNNNQQLSELSLNAISGNVIAQPNMVLVAQGFSIWANNAIGSATTPLQLEVSASKILSFALGALSFQARSGIFLSKEITADSLLGLNTVGTPTAINWLQQADCTPCTLQITNLGASQNLIIPVSGINLQNQLTHQDARVSFILQSNGSITTTDVYDSFRNGAIASDILTIRASQVVSINIRNYRSAVASSVSISSSCDRSIRYYCVCL